MKKCSDCNIKMIDNCIISGQHPFEVGVDGKTNISISIPTNEKSEILGLTFDKVKKERLKARVCPNCGKVELYINISHE